MYTGDFKNRNLYGRIAISYVADSLKKGINCRKKFLLNAKVLKDCHGSKINSYSQKKKLSVINLEHCPLNMDSKS